MPRGASAFLVWPWQWLTGRDPQPFGAPSNVQPTLDVTNHGPGPQIYSESFTMAAGTNTIELPGYQRASDLNGAGAAATGNGARKWLSLRLASDTALAGGDNVALAYRVNAVDHLLWEFDVNWAWPADIGLPLIRSSTWWTNSTDHLGDVLPKGVDFPVYVPDPGILWIALLSQPLNAVVTVSGLYLEADSIHTPLPDPFR